MRNIFVSCLVMSMYATIPLPVSVDGAEVYETRPKDIEVDFQESYFESRRWIKEFRYVIVVNKAISGDDSQTIKIYEYGKLITAGRVSTGRDKFERAGEHGSVKAGWTVTPTGYYTPSYLDKNHKSTAYRRKWSWLLGGVKMPYAIFFNDGIALHQAPAGTESLLGKNVSGGCIRISEEIAADIFMRIQETEGAMIPKFKVDGTVELDLDNNFLRSASHFSALIVVKNKVK